MDQNLDEKVRFLVWSPSGTAAHEFHQALRELEAELHTQIYPGTEIMTDVGTHHFVKSSAGGHSVLVPQPSDDEHDPLVCPHPRPRQTGEC